MEDTFFTIEEAARILNCKRSTVYQLLANGWLSRPLGGTRGSGSGRVTKKSLYQLLIIDRANQLPRKTLRKLRNGTKLFAGISSKNAEASCLSIDEGASQTPRLQLVPQPLLPKI